MKDGAYVCGDERQGVELRCSALVSVALLNREGGTQVLSVGNFGGSSGLELPWPIRHPDFVDDDANGRAVIPTPEGIVRLSWPTVEDYTKILEELGTEIKDAPPADAPEKARQKFLKSLC